MVFEKLHTPWNKGLEGVQKHTEATKEMISSTCKKVGVGKWLKGKTEELNNNWAGDKVGYRALHQWVESKLGTPRYCEHCKRTDKNKYEWANKDHTYKRKKEDWERLCTSCHRKYDIAQRAKDAVLEAINHGADPRNY